MTGQEWTGRGDECGEETSDFVNHAGQLGLGATWPRQAPTEVCFGRLEPSFTPVIDRFLSLPKVSNCFQNQFHLLAAIQIISEFQAKNKFAVLQSRKKKLRRRLKKK